MGFPATTVDGKTVDITEKGSFGDKVILRDRDGNVYESSDNGLILIEAAVKNGEAEIEDGEVIGSAEDLAQAGEGVDAGSTAAEDVETGLAQHLPNAEGYSRVEDPLGIEPMAEVPLDFTPDDAGAAEYEAAVAAAQPIEGDLNGDGHLGPFEKVVEFIGGNVDAGGDAADAA